MRSTFIKAQTQKMDYTLFANHAVKKGINLKEKTILYGINTRSIEQKNTTRKTRIRSLNVKKNIYKHLMAENQTESNREDLKKSILIKSNPITPSIVRLKKGKYLSLIFALFAQLKDLSKRIMLIMSLKPELLSHGFVKCVTQL